jgi:hypothetical protein
MPKQKCMKPQEKQKKKSKNETVSRNPHIKLPQNKAAKSQVEMRWQSNPTRFSPVCL